MRKVSFGSEAFAYLREQLALGDDIANALLQLPLESGSMMGYFPDEVNSPEAFRFELSILLTSGLEIRSTLQESTIELMLQYLKRSETNCIVLETLFDTSFPSLKLLDVPYVIHESNVYLTISPSYSDIALAISESRGYPFICILISLPKSLNLYPNSEISGETLEILAKATDYIFVGAYDDEGYVIWENSQAKYQISL